MTQEEIFIKTAITAWETWTSRATKTFAALTDEQMLLEIAPGKNRAVYLLGHLIAVNDAMIPQLRLGEASHSNLNEPFLKQPDRSVSEIPPVADLRQFWTEVHATLAQKFATLTPAEWLERHALVSEEDFAAAPQRNRLSILLSRTSHVSYHLGQLLLLKK
jgi:hypothetical protein